MGLNSVLFSKSIPALVAQSDVRPVGEYVLNTGKPLSGLSLPRKRVVR